MSSLEDLRCYLASAGYSPERIAEIELTILRGAAAAWVHPDHTAFAIHRMLEFEASMTQLAKDVGTAMHDMQAICDGIEALPEDTPEVKPPAKQPYYQKNKQRWWK